MYIWNFKPPLQSCGSSSTFKFKGRADNSQFNTPVPWMGIQLSNHVGPVERYWAEWIKFCTRQKKMDARLYRVTFSGACDIAIMWLCYDVRLVSLYAQIIKTSGWSSCINAYSPTQGLNIESPNCKSLENDAKLSKTVALIACMATVFRPCQLDW